MKSFMMLVVSFLISVLLINCKKDTSPNPMPAQAEVIGTVKDETGGRYPKSTVILDNGTVQLEAKTNQLGEFSFDTEQTGAFEATIQLPLASTFVSSTSMMIDLERDVTKTLNFVIRPEARNANVNIGPIDLFGEIRNANNQPPTTANETLYAKNVFDAPLGSLHPIMAPDNHHVTLSEWNTAQGNVMASCQGASSKVEINLQGMIPNGTYTLWCNFLNKPKTPGQSVNFGTDVVKIEPLGSGTENVVIADNTGRISRTITHPSCVLTEAVALVLVVDYHLNGNTFGAGHTPDEEAATHMLIYFQ